MNISYPGTQQHQALLGTIAAHYAADTRVRALALFGSLARGGWDRYSDLDLDVVLADGVTIEVRAELQQLAQALAPLGERVLLYEVHDDAGELILASLLQISLRYHPLQATSPNIVDQLVVLAGSLTAAEIGAAGRLNHVEPLPLPRDWIERWLRHALAANISLQRGQLWRAVQFLHLLQDGLIGAYGASRNTPRPYHAFEESASPALRTLFGATLPGFSLASAQQALAALLHLVEVHLQELSAGQLALDDQQREVIAALRDRQARLAR